jgi:hypothetical protein
MICDLMYTVLYFDEVSYFVRSIKCYFLKFVQCSNLDTDSECNNTVM